MTAYEAIFIVDPTLPEEQTTAIVEKYKSVITRESGVVNDVDVWESKRLMYTVKGHREGRYIVVNFVGPATAKDELTRIFRISDDALRFLIIKQDPRADLYPGKTRAVENERRAAEQAARAAAYPPAAPAPVTELAVETPVEVVPVLEEAPEVVEEAEAPVAEAEAAE